MTRSLLPAQLGPEFSTMHARSLGITPGRLRGRDLQAPFRGIRQTAASDADPSSPYEAARTRELALIRALSRRLDEGHFFSHRSAALLWGAPLPHRSLPDLHLGVVKPRRAPRIAQVTGHCFEASRAEIVRLDGIPLCSPAICFASLGELPLPDLVALGDFLVRKHRSGHGRRNVGRPALATIPQLVAAVDLGRWKQAPRLREALPLIREDSWSPRESGIRLALVAAGLPEPSLNVDIRDDEGRFLACVDMVYLKYRVIVEYHGEQHSHTYAEDVERIEGLRAEGWEVIQVTRALGKQPRILVARVTAALRARGWRGETADSGANGQWMLP